MSIWCSRPHIGHDDDEPEESRGEVRAYRSGFSNHFPDDTDGAATVSLAVIAPWCVPGHDQAADDYTCSGCGLDHEHPQCGPWVRLSVYSPAALSWWRLFHGEPTRDPRDATVVLDIAAATALRDDLTAWLRQPKVMPTAEPDERTAP